MVSAGDPSQPLLYAHHRSALGGRGRVGSVWVAGLVWLVLAGFCVHLIFSVTSAQSALSECVSWWREAKSYHKNLEELAYVARDARGMYAGDILEQLPSQLRSELREPRLLYSVPLARGIMEDSVAAWSRSTPALAAGIEHASEDPELPAEALAEPAGAVSVDLAAVMRDVTEEITRRAELLDADRAWLYGVAILSVLAAGAFIVLNFRVRRSRDALSIFNAALGESEERYRSMFEQNKAIQLVVHSGTRRIVDANAAACAFYGGSRDELTSKRLTDFWVRPTRGSQPQPTVADEDGSPILFRHRLLTGDVRDVEIRSSTVSYGGRKMQYSIIHDVTERLRAERALQRSEERLTATLRSMADGVISTDTDGRVRLMNAAAEQLTGWTSEKAQGRPLLKVFHVVEETTGATQDKRFERMLRGEAVAPSGSAMVLTQRTGGQHVVAEVSTPLRDHDGSVAGLVIVMRDVTEQRRLEEEMLRAQRLDSLGVLAGGIAHDFNNFLTGMLANLSLARQALNGQAEASERLARAEGACLQAKDLTRQLQTFARGGTLVRKTASLEELTRETVEFALRGSNVRREIEVAPDLHAADIDKGRINQVLHNLVLNADQAMPDGGVLTVGAQNVQVDGSEGLPIEPGPYVRIRVSDTGVGIPQETRGRIFDPYFTTKETGTGLGLATSYSIVRKHDGCMALESEVGQGTTFFVYLPASQAAVEDEAEDTAATVPSGGGRVLVMEGDADVREATGNMLENMGCAVELTADGKEALEAYVRGISNMEPYDLVVLDLTVPGGMGGKEAMRRLREIDADAQVVVTSGYENDPLMADPEKYGFCGRLAKPYSRDDLATLLGRVLSGRARA